MPDFEIRPLTSDDQVWLREMIQKHFGGLPMFVLGIEVDFEAIEGLVAEDSKGPLGSLTYRIEGDRMEIVTLHSEAERRGVGTCLMDRMREIAADNGCKRLHLVTTNDNLQALGFYQRRGWRMTAVHPDSLKKEISVKPQMEDMGLNGIPILDEIELELKLD
jgi:GNAT superfamily N-acetyltransferase